MPRRSRAAILPTNLLALQNLLKREPASYRDEFLQQLEHYRTQLQILRGSPATAKSGEFGELVSFIAQVSLCFPQETAEFPADVAGLLRNHKLLDVDLRDRLVQTLALLRNKGVLSSAELLRTLVPILSATESKSLRALIYSTVVAVVKAENQKGRNHVFNKLVQAMLFEMVQSTAGDGAGLWAVRLTKEMWQKHVWQGDGRAVEICKDAALSLELKVMLAGIYFFLGVDNGEEESSEDEGPDLRKLQHQAGINKTSKNRRQQVLRAMKADKKKRRGGDTKENVNFPAIQLLHDPQGFAEKLFSQHLTSKRPLSFEYRLLALSLLSRLIAAHKLTLLSLYSHVLKWVSPHQRDVTKVLASLAGAVHEFVPPEVVEPAVKKIANEFCTAGVNPEVVCAGLNTIREIAARQPEAIDATLLSDLIEYKTSKDKGVNTAARGLIALFRTVAPEMLPKKERGKTASMQVSDGTAPKLQFGVERGVTRGIEGLEGLDDEEDEDADEEAWDQFEVESVSSDDQGWTNVESDADIDFSDSDDEGEKDDEKAIKPVVVLSESIATKRILTPADLKKLAEAKGTQQSQQRDGPQDYLEAGDITGPHVKRGRDDKAARLASVAEGREGRDAFGSHKKRRTEEGRSTTNREKARKKNFAMAKNSRDVRLKQGRKLTIKRKELRAHLDRSKRGGRRGNR